MKKFRTNGAIGALLDEYERALADLKHVIANVSDEDLVKIADDTTKDPDCQSIQTVLSHVVKSGYGYAIYIANAEGENLVFPTNKKLPNVAAYNNALDEMFAFNEAVFARYPDLELEEYDTSKKMLMRWGQRYDVDQLMEHAVMHVLRHRRQIEKFKQL